MSHPRAFIVINYISMCTSMLINDTMWLHSAVALGPFEWGGGVGGGGSTRFYQLNGRGTQQI